MAYLVRSFQTNARIRSLTTGTFNRVVKDRIAFRLSGANSVQANPHKCESDCPRNLTNIRCCARPCQRERPTEFPPDFHNGKSGRASARGAIRSMWDSRHRLSSRAKLDRYSVEARPCQRERPTEFPPDFHNGNPGRRTPGGSTRQPKASKPYGFVIPNRRSRRGICFCLPGAQTRATVWPSASKEAPISAHAEAEDRKLRKELAFGGPCLEGTLQKPTGCFRIKPRGRGD